MFRKGEQLKVIKPREGDGFIPNLKMGQIVTVVKPNNERNIIRIKFANGKKFGYYADRFERVTSTNYSDIKQQILEM